MSDLKRKFCKFENFSIIIYYVNATYIKHDGGLMYTLISHVNAEH